MTPSRRPNTFTVHQPNLFAAPGYVRWNPHDEADRPDPLCLFWGRVLRRVDDALPNRGYRFFVTWSNDAIPEYGDDVIAVHLTDDRGRIPAYAGEIGLLFKQFGLKYPFPMPRIAFTPFYANLLATRVAATLYRRLPYALRAYRGVFAGRHPHLVSLPGGYYHAGDRVPPRIADRPTDVAFLGSLEGNGRFSRFLPSVKFQIRSFMLEALERLRGERPEAVIRTRVSPTYTQAIVTSPAEYTQALYETKIALAPQGLASESYRYHEAVRAGAVVISGKMPRYGYFRDAPTVIIDSWQDLPAVAGPLLDDPTNMQRIADASLAWWEATCSESAVARMMIEAIERVAARSCRCLTSVARSE